MDTWRIIKLQLKFNLESNWIRTIQFLHSIINSAQKLKIQQDIWRIIKNPIEI